VLADAKMALNRRSDGGSRRIYRRQKLLFGADLATLSRFNKVP